MNCEECKQYEALREENEALKDHILRERAQRVNIEYELMRLRKERDSAGDRKNNI